MAQFLSTNGVTKAFGGLLAVNDVTLDVQKGELVGLIGPNGSGKTTLINLITGTLRATSGDVVFKGQNITHLPTHVRTGMGIARTFQILTTYSRPYGRTCSLQQCSARMPGCRTRSSEACHCLQWKRNPCRRDISNSHLIESVIGSRRAPTKALEHEALAMGICSLMRQRASTARD